MSHDKRVHGRGEAGFTLIEMMLAATIFAIVAAVVFIFYTAAQKSYKAGENFSDQQQSTRVAFDRMVSDIRLAGFNTNPDGDTSRVDEQVEGAWDTAVTVRGDFDFEDPAASVTPEASLAGTVYNVVSTGNDEIVTYVLAKPGPVGPDTLTIRVDPDKPRSKAVKTVTIPNVALVQNNPPYTLYRVTLADVAGSFPSSPQASSSFVFEPVADNIKSMTFRYWPDSGAELGPNTPTNSADDIGGDDAAILTRAKIRKITVNLVGMTPNPDIDYVDATDATATTHYRKFDLTSDVNPENLGKTAIKDIDITPPPTPTNVSLVPGHCSGMLVKWDPPSISSGVTTYALKYWPNGSPASFGTTSVTYPHQEWGVVDYLGHGFVSGLTGGASYCFQVQARDLAGNQSGWAPTTAPCATVAESTTPDAATGLTATGNGTLTALDSQITLTWSEVKTNNSALTGDPNSIGGHTILRDAAGYKLYRDVVSSFTPNDATNMVANNTTLPVGALTWTDPNVANCQTYYYKVHAVDTCGVAGADSTFAGGQAVTTIAPSQPTGLTSAHPSKLVINLTWTAVTTKVNGTPDTINLYKIYRVELPTGTSPASISSGAYTLIGTANTNSYTDTLTNQLANDLNQGMSYFYAVSAADLCGNESIKSSPTEVFCQFAGTVTLTPGNGGSGAGSVPIGVSISGPDNYVRARLHIPALSGSGDTYDQSSYSYPFSFPAWNGSSSGPGQYTLYWEVENQHGCIYTTTTTFTVVASLACQITPTNPNFSPTSGKPSNLNKNVAWDIINNSGKDLSITSLDITWTSSIGTHKILSIQYPTATTVTTFSGSGAATPATASYALFPLLLPKTDDGTCGTCKVNNTLAFDTQMVNSSGAGEQIHTVYHFQDTTGTTGTCTFTVFPDLTIASGP